MLRKIIQFVSSILMVVFRYNTRLRIGNVGYYKNQLGIGDIFQCTNLFVFSSHKYVLFFCLYFRYST